MLILAPVVLCCGKTAIICRQVAHFWPIFAPISNPEIAANRSNKVALQSLKDIKLANIPKDV